MAYARHETFYIRDGWLRKGLKLVEKKGFDFFNSNDAPEELGIGKNMVQSLKFWLQATNMVESEGERKNEPSDFAKIISKYDPYFEDEATLWLIHYYLVTNKNQATTWFWFFNVFNHKEFDEETFLFWLNNFTKTEGTTVAASSLRKDYQCLINSYLLEKSNGKNNSPEENINCPLRGLMLIKKTGPKTYRLNQINRASLHPLIVFYAISNWPNIYHRNNSKKNDDYDLNKNDFCKCDNQSIIEKRYDKTTISNILDDQCNAGKVFNLNYEDLIYFLEKLQDLGYLSVTRTAGMDAVNIEQMTPIEILETYYQNKE